MAPPSKFTNYHAVGLRTDCVKIIERFAKLNTLRYHAFTDLWRELKFSFIYYGHSCFEELIEFTEEALRIAKEMWLKNEVLNEQAGGLYLLYGLYLKQPTDGLVKVRLSPQDYQLVEKFHLDVKEGGHHDANYVLARMHIIGAFRFCVSEYAYGLEKSYRVYHEKDKSLLEVNDEPLYLKRLKNDAIFCKLDDAFKRYHESKCKLVSEKSKRPSSVLQYVDPQFAQKLKEQFQKITHFQEEGDSSKSQETNIGSSSGTAKSQPDNSASNKSNKLPWWMVPVRNRIRKESSSEDEDDPEIVSQPLEGTRREDLHEPLHAKLGLSGDEEEIDVDGDEHDEARKKRLQELKDFSEAGCSQNMPDLF